MTENDKINWQIRVNVYGTTEEAYTIQNTIENAMGRERVNDVRLINIDKDEGNVDDETQYACKACGCLSDDFYDGVCGKCLMKEKADRQAEEDAKYDDDKRGTEWDWVSICPDCGVPTMYDADQCYWYCNNQICRNLTHDTSVNAYAFDAHRMTVAELAELTKKYPYAGWI